MADIPGITRRDFICNSALVTATAAMAQAAGVPHAGSLGEVMGTAKAGAPVFPYGAVYFRKSNPPEQDWTRDHQTAARIGMNTFRDWFMWSAIEVAPGKYDWADTDRMMDLAAENGIKVIINELVTCAPEWAFRKYPSARFLGSDGSVINSTISGSSATGGFPGLCLDNPEVKALAERFLVALIERYRNHPALLAYDLWSEVTYEGGSAQKMYCYCEATKKKLREWLNTRYGSLDKVRKIWQRYSYETWEDLEPPREFSGYAESLDWLQFRVDNANSLFHWRAKLFRRLDPNHLVVAQGVAGTLDTYPSSAHNEWMTASQVDVWGLTWVASRKGNEPWKQYHALDLVRAGARGKPFWHAQAQGGPLWMQPQEIGRPKDDGRIADSDDVRIWNLVSCAGGASGIFYPRWRPLLDGPLFGAFGPFGMDGSVTPRAEMAGRVARWANDHPGIWNSHPVKGDVGLLFAPESELFNYMQQRSTSFYSDSVCGAYQAFFDSNIQPDFVALEDIDEYRILYVAYPVMLRAETVARLKKYVEQGGTLICEGLPAYFGDHGHVGTTQPNYGLDEVFGARESYVEFLPDISDDLTLEIYDSKIYGRYFRQDYELKSGKVVGHYSNGAIAAVENTFGKGRTLLIGSFPGAGYYLHHAPSTKELFSGFLRMAGTTPKLSTNNSAVQARLHQGQGGSYLWVTNPTAGACKVTVSLEPGIGEFTNGEDLWGKQVIAVSGQQIAVSLPAKDAAVIALR